MARARAKKTQVQSAAAETETLPPGATDFDTEEYESAAHAQEASRASEQRESAAVYHYVDNAERPKPQHAEAESGRDVSGRAGQHAAQGTGHAATVERKPYRRPADPLGFENQKAGENRVQLLKSEGEGAWVIRFAHNPNLDKGPEGEAYSKETPHPVLKMLKEAGFRWRFDGGDGKGGWGKGFTGDAYGQDHIEARKVLQKAADIIGHRMDHGRIPD